MEEANSSFTFYNVWGLTKVLWGNWCSISSGLLSLGSINNICSQLPLLSLRDLKIAQPYGFNSTFLECLYLSRLPSKFPTKTSIVQTVEVWDLWGPLVCASGRLVNAGRRMAAALSHTVTGLWSLAVSGGLWLVCGSGVPRASSVPVLLDPDSTFGASVSLESVPTLRWRWSVSEIMYVKS